jgi:hypothetical protein
MIETELKAGDIFTWKNYPMYIKEFKQQRWLLYLDNQSVEAVAYQITTTTQYGHYEAGGDRRNNNFFKTPAGVGGLVMDSIVDLTLCFETIPETLLNDRKADIEKRGSLTREYADKLVRHIKADRHIIPVMKKDIFSYLRDAGFM